MIPTLNQEWIANNISAYDRALQAWNIRHDARTKAREMMKDKELTEILRARDEVKYGNPNGATFDYLVNKFKLAGLEGDAIYEAIIESSHRTDKQTNANLKK